MTIASFWFAYVVRAEYYWHERCQYCIRGCKSSKMGMLIVNNCWGSFSIIQTPRKNISYKIDANGDLMPRPRRQSLTSWTPNSLFPLYPIAAAINLIIFPGRNESTRLHVPKLRTKLKYRIRILPKWYLYLRQSLPMSEKFSKLTRIRRHLWYVDQQDPENRFCSFHPTPVRNSCILGKRKGGF